MYTKQDAKMTQGLAIVCMVVLHLFCRQGGDVLGQPLIWLNETTPFVYWFGFFAEICVPLYALCMGYAQGLLLENGKSGFKSRMKRIGALMVNYWVILVLFSIIGLVVDPAGGIPGSFLDFAKAALLLKSYNGAWWFLHTYVFLLLLPPKVLLYPARKFPAWLCVVLCLGLYIGLYIKGKIGVFSFSNLHPIVDYTATELQNMVGVLAYVWLGALICRCRFMDKLAVWWDKRIPKRFQKVLLLLMAVLLFVGANAAHKALLMGPVAVAVFLLFNLWKKSSFTQKIMLFLGNHSTNIWLVHMFFYAYLFVGLVEYAAWPIPMLLFMLALCIGTSYVIKGCLWCVNTGARMPRKMSKPG